MSSAIEIMKKRVSVRNYDAQRSIEPEKIQEIESTLHSLSNENMRFVLITSELTGVKLGTYGMISGIRQFVVGIMKEVTKENTIAFGAQFEKFVLKATELDLGTCWMIGTYNPKDFEQFLHLKEDETIVIVSPVGYAKGKERFRDKLVRAMTKNHTRKPFGDLFYENNAETPLTEEKAGQYAEALEMVRLAPSASNKQPWRVIRDGNSFHFYTKEESMTQYRGVRCCYNDVGIAMEHFEQACRELNLSGEWKTEQAPKIDAWEYIKTWSA